MGNRSKYDISNEVITIAISVRLIAVNNMALIICDNTYLFDMKKLSDIEWNGSVGHRTLRFYRSIISDICSHSKCNRLVLKDAKKYHKDEHSSTKPLSRWLLTKQRNFLKIAMNFKRTLAASREAAPRFPKSLRTISLSSSKLLESEMWFVWDSES